MIIYRAIKTLVCQSSMAQEMHGPMLNGKDERG